MTSPLTNMAPDAAPETTNRPRRRQIYFVTGTDTDVGKTTVSAALLARAASQGHRCFGLKPVSAGCGVSTDGQRMSPDAEQLCRVASVSLPMELIAPIRLETPASPHLAAALEQRQLSASRITGFVRAGLSTPASHVLIEGAGGWRVPINARETLANVARELNYPVILVVGLRLGCLNHALLTAEAIQRDGLTLAGYVVNHLEPDLLLAAEQEATLAHWLRAPCLGSIPFDGQTPEPRQLLDCLRWPDELAE